MDLTKPFILISNDDGYMAKGINDLVGMLLPMANILVCAPDGARSGFSCAFSATTPLQLKLHSESQGLQIWSCNGTPVDCVKMALSELCERKPDLVIGGINHGDNASVNTHYSGTMGVVMEGCMKGIPSIGYSLCDHDPEADFDPLKPYIQRITKEVLKQGLPFGTCLNVNFPKGTEYQGVRVCRMANGTWGNELVKCHHPRQYDYYWMVGKYTNDEPEAEDTDNWALTHHYVAITPTTMDVTAYGLMEQMKGWKL